MARSSLENGGRAPSLSREEDEDAVEINSLDMDEEMKEPEEPISISSMENREAEVRENDTCEVEVGSPTSPAERVAEEEEEVKARVERTRPGEPTSGRKGENDHPPSARARARQWVSWQHVAVGHP